MSTRAEKRARKQKAKEARRPAKIGLATSPDISGVSWKLGLTLLVCLIATAIVGYAVYLHQRAPSVANPVAVIAVTSAVSVGIERVLEMIWTMMDQWKGSSWPFSAIGTNQKAVETTLNEKLMPYFTKAAELVKGTAEKAEWINQRREQLDTLLKAAATDADLTAVSTKAASDMQAVQKIVGNGQLTTDFNIATSAIKDVSDFVSSFSENPARRIISIFGGMCIGLVVAAFVGLDAIAAALEHHDGTIWGLILTGLLMGLGSSPTHEVVQSLQEYKANKQAQTTTQAST